MKVDGKRILNSFCFGPVLVLDGEIVEDFGLADSWINMSSGEERQRVAKAYMRELDGVVKLPKIPDGNVSVWAQFCVQHPKRDAIVAALKDKGIPCNVYYPKPMHLLGAMEYLGLGPGAFPNAEEVSRQVFALPMHPYLSEDDIAEVSSAVREAVQK